MCVICVSERGIPQPTEQQIGTMFRTNPHGAGYMVARSGWVEYRKGFMNCADLLAAIRSERFTPTDSVVYHFRISTQAGVTPAMTHPFPLTHRLSDCKQLGGRCALGVAHNGIIRLTADMFDNEYNDTARFIVNYLSFMVRSKSDMTNPRVIRSVEELSRSRWALMYRDGTISTIGYFIRESDGLLFSNRSYMNSEELHFEM